MSQCEDISAEDPSAPYGASPDVHGAVPYKGSGMGQLRVSLGFLQVRKIVSVSVPVDMVLKRTLMHLAAPVLMLVVLLAIQVVRYGLAEG